MKKAQLNRIQELDHPLPSGANKELYDVFFAALKEKRAEWMDETKDYCKLDSTTTIFIVKIQSDPGNILRCTELLSL